jgi:hypothetical protein
LEESIVSQLLTTLIWEEAYNKLRISANQLNIETVRYTGLPPELKICFKCNLYEAEDELHFLLVCPKYDNETSRENIKTNFIFSFVCNTCWKTTNVDSQLSRQRSFVLAWKIYSWKWWKFMYRKYSLFIHILKAYTVAWHVKRCNIWSFPFVFHNSP